MLRSDIEKISVGLLENRRPGSVFAFRIETPALIPLVRIGVVGGDPLNEQLLTLKMSINPVRS